MGNEKDEHCSFEPAEHAALSSVVEVLSSYGDIMPRHLCMSGERRQPLPSGDVIREIVEAMRSVFFPGYFGASEANAETVKFYIGTILDRVRRMLNDQVLRGICFNCDGERECHECRQKAADVTASFIAQLPEIKRMLTTDVRAAYEGDPAATSPDEAIFCYPGIRAVTSYRIAHAVYEHDVPIIPRIITEQAHSDTGIDIHPGARIGESFFIDHGTGVVIGETSIIGSNVQLYQGVTLGAKSFPLDENGNPVKGVDRHPVVEDDVIIYSGTTILGRVTIGKGSVIGGNVWITQDVAPGSRITQASAR